MLLELCRTSSVGLDRADLLISISVSVCELCDGVLKAVAQEFMGGGCSRSGVTTGAAESVLGGLGDCLGGGTVGVAGMGMR